MRITRKKIAGLLCTGALASALVLIGSAPAQAETLVGNDVHLAEYCTWKHGAASFAYNIDNSWSGWRCSLMSVSYSVDMNEACRHAYGNGVYARNYPVTWNGWHCYR